MLRGIDLGIDAVIQRLRTASDIAHLPWPDMVWQPSTGKPITLSRGTFVDLPLPPRQRVDLRTELRVPRSIGPVSLDQEPLYLTIDSIYPLQLLFQGRELIGRREPPVAPGPEETLVSPAISEGTNGELRLVYDVPQSQTWLNWLYFRFSTPALRRRADAIDLLLSRLALASELATTPAERSQVAESALLIPLDLELVDQEGLDELDRMVAQHLEGFADRLEKLSVHVIGHSHLDLSWLWTWPDTTRVIKRDVAGVLGLMDEYPELTFTQSQAVTFDVIERDSPELFQSVLHHITEGRWEVAAMQWVETDLNLPSGESLARSILYGVSHCRERLGVSPTVFLAPDAFGHSGNLPQLVTSAGAHVYYHERCNPGTSEPHTAYSWRGDDGTRILNVSTPRYWGQVTIKSIADAAIAALKQGLSSGLFFHGVGNHGGGPTREGLDRLRMMAGLKGFPKTACSTLARYASDVGDSELPEHVGELGSLFEGCYSTNREMKLRNRRAENALTSASTLAAVARLDQEAALRAAWKTLSLAQFHDTLCGSAIADVYDQVFEELDDATRSASEVIASAFVALTETAAAESIVVTNPLGWTRRDVVVVPGVTGSGPFSVIQDDGSVIPAQHSSEGLVFVAEVATFGCRQYTLGDRNVENRDITVVEDDDVIRVETEWYRAHLHRESGSLVSLRVGETGPELVRFGGRRPTDYIDSARLDLAINVLQVVDEAPHDMSAWHFDDVIGERYLIAGGSSQLIEVGPVRAIVRTIQRFGSSEIVRDIIFYQSLPRIDVTCTIDWRESGSREKGITNLKVSSTASLGRGAAWFESPFGACERAADGQEVVAQRWADVSDNNYGLAMLNDGIYGHDALGCRLRLTLLRSSYEPNDVGDVGQHVMKYSLCPHAGDWRQAGVPKLAAGFNQTLIAKAGVVCRADVSALRPTLGGDPNVLLTSLKRAEKESAWVARLQECEGRPATVYIESLRPAIRSVNRASIVEDPLGNVPIDLDGRARLSMRPWEVSTLLFNE